MLEMKEAWKRQRNGSTTTTGFIVQAGALWRGIPARELEHTGHTQAWARYRGLVEKYQEGHKGIPLLGNQER
jgi:hypothetical protein